MGEAGGTGSSRWLRDASVACALVLVGLGLSLLIDEWAAASPARYAAMVGAVAIATIYARPAAVLPGLVLAWLLAWFVLARPRWSLDPGAHDEVIGWILSLLTSVAVVLAASVLGEARRRAETRARRAERARVRSDSLQRLTSALSRALQPEEVARAIVETLPEIVGSEGAALGLIAGAELEIVDPRGPVAQTLTPGLRLPLETRAPITTAARLGEVTHARSRRDFETRFPDGARLAPYASGAVAVPLLVRGRVVGSVGLPFVGTIEDEAIVLAEVAADLGSQALERAYRYAEERETRMALERLGRLGVLLADEDRDTIVATVTREARDTLACDSARMLERVETGVFVSLASEPDGGGGVAPPIVAGSDAEALDAIVERFEPLYDTVDDGSARLRIPVAAAGRPKYVLELEWHPGTSEPRAATVALAERLADQAGVAFENAARRAAQEEADRSSEETSRLLDLTTALAAAIEPSDVGNAVLSEALRGFRAAGGTVVAVVDGALEVVASTDATRRERKAVAVDDPIAAVVRENELRLLGADGAPMSFAPAVTPAWVGLPLSAGGDVVGGVELVFGAPRQLTGDDRRFGIALARQAGQALGRSLLLGVEQAARVRAERMARELAQLHAVGTSLTRAGSAAEVAGTVAQHVVAAVRADAAAVYGVETGDHSLVLLGDSVETGVQGSFVPRVSLGDRTAFAEADRRSASIWLTDADHLADAARRLGFPEPSLSGVAIVPMTVHGRSAGVLCVVFGQHADLDAQARSLVETMARQAAQPLERVRALEQERVSRLRAERATGQLGRLQQLTASLSRALTPREVVDVLVTHAPAAVGATCIAMIAGERGELTRVAGDCRDLDDVVDTWLAEPPTTGDPVRAVLRSGEASYFESIDDVRASHPGLGHGLERTGTAYAFVPVTAGGGSLGVAVLTWTRPTVFSPELRSFVETVASQCGQALDRAARYEAERQIAETLQRSVLPQTLPSLEGARVAARYLPGSTAVDVGGDWFDTIPLPDGRLAFVVGDVVGKGVQAASTMAQMRNGMRALALDSADPARIVTRLNRLLDGSSEAPFATMVMLVFDPATLRAELVSAGHLPPIVVRPDGTTALLEGRGGLPLGVDPDASYTSWHETLTHGSSVLLYTDGLVERRDRPLDEGLRQLADAATCAGDPEPLADRVLERLIGDAERADDVALLVVSLDRAPLGELRLHLPVTPDSLVRLRSELTDWLDRANVVNGDRHDIVLAAWEAAANAIEHAVDPAQPSFTLQAALSGDKVHVVLADTGGWRDRPPRADRGLGLRLIRSLMTSVDVDAGDAGTTIRMERTLSREWPGG